MKCNLEENNLKLYKNKFYEYNKYNCFYSDNSQIEAIKTFMKTLEIKFEIEEKPYNPEFVVKIRQSEKEIQQGKTIAVKKEDFKQFLGL